MRAVSGFPITPPAFQKNQPVRSWVNDLINLTPIEIRESVVRHLVGATLAICFPKLSVGNFAFSAADDQAGRSGDFRIHDMAFHVTAAPTMGHIARCGENLREGLAAFLLVPDTELTAAHVLLKQQSLFGKIAVESIESFVGQNLSELAEFDPRAFAAKIGELLREYNRRVDEAETDGSLLIEIPTALTGDKG